MSSPSESQPHECWRASVICFLLALGIGVVFGQTLRHEFVNYDDDVCVYDNPAITHGINWSGIVRAFRRFNNFEWAPLTSISHMLDCQIYRLNAGGHHLTNVLLHAATVISLFLVLRRMTGAFWRSAFVAAVFALHPLDVESVAWVSERKGVLSGLFFVLTIGAYVRYVRQPFKTSCYLLVPALFALGLLSKAMVVTLPFVLLLLDYWPLARWRAGSQTPPQPERLNPNANESSTTFRRLIIEKIPLFLLAAAGSVATFLATRNAESVLAAQGLNFPYRLSNALVAYVDYIGHMLYPVGLASGYPNPRNHLSVLTIGWSVSVLMIISAGVLIWRRKCPCLLVGWLWYLGMLVPVIDIMQAGHQARADRYTYLPQIGLYILAAWGATELCGSWRYRRAALGAASVAILSGLMAAAQVQTAYWKDSVSLWTHCLACTPENDVAHNNLGTALTARGKLDEAIYHFERALQLEPDYSDAHNNLGFALLAQGKLPEAIQQCSRALQLNPDLVKAHLNLGIALAAQGKLDQAIEHYELALRLKPAFSDAQFSLGLALAAQGRFDQAIEHYELALQLKPDNSQAQSSLGLALAREGKPGQAIEHLRKALELNPDYSAAHNNLGAVLAAQGKLDEAISHFNWALQLKPNNAEASNNLARALAAQATNSISHGLSPP